MIDLEPEVYTPKGFYYDIQTKDPATRISLHPNTVVTGYTQDVWDSSNPSKHLYDTGDTCIIPIWEDFSSGGSNANPNSRLPLVSTRRFGGDRSKPEILTWFTPEDPENSPEIFKTGRYGKWTSGEDGNRPPTNYPYAKEAICSAILNEDFRVNVSNNFSKLGGDPLGEFINSAKSALPIMGEVSNFLKNIAKKTSETSENWKKEGKDTSAVDTLGKYLNMASGWTNVNKALMNRAIVFQGARFSYFGGTGVAFDNVALNYTMFPYWDTEDCDDNGFPKFKTIYDQLEIILPYVIGDFVPLVFSEVVKTGSESKAVSFLKDIEGEAKGIASSFGSWQLPPAGFEAAIKDIDVIQKGTLKLKVGSLYSIDNIVITSCNFTLSKHLIKHPQIEAELENATENAAQYLTPAFCDVQLGLKPVSMASKNSLLRFIRGEGTVSDKRQVYINHQSNLAEAENRVKRAFEEKPLPLTNEQIKEVQGSEVFKPTIDVSNSTSLRDQNIYDNNVSYV